MKIDEGWFKSGFIPVVKKQIPVYYKQATKAGTIQTLEGPAKYEAHDFIVTGPEGEEYPVPFKKFLSLYKLQPTAGSPAVPNRILKIAKLADHDGVLHKSFGDLEYKKDEHFIVYHGPGD